jgi:hypothetical protein
VSCGAVDEYFRCLCILCDLSLQINKYVFLVGCFYASARRQNFCSLFCCIFVSGLFVLVNMNPVQSQLEERSNSFVQENVHVGGAQRLTARNLLQ